MLLLRCWSVICSVWYFGGSTAEEKCPGCGNDGEVTDAKEHGQILNIWHQ